MYPTKLTYIITNVSFSNYLSSAYHSAFFFHSWLSFWKQNNIIHTNKCNRHNGRKPWEQLLCTYRADLSLLASPFCVSLESRLWEGTVELYVPLVCPALICPLPPLCAPGEISIQAKSNSWLYSAIENSISCLKRYTQFFSLSYFIWGLNG